MNYLAHFHLASQIEDQGTAMVIGALLGDFVKGPLRGNWPRDWEAGIALHRRIDAMTDSHPEVCALLEALPAEYRRFGGIMLDVCFDHCLSENWSRFHDQPLAEFNQQIYGILAGIEREIPPAATRQARRLQRYDVLGSMGSWQTIDAMLTGIGQRLRRDNPLNRSAEVLQQQLPEIEQRFLRLYPELLNTLF